jgi:hypothetical protein
LPLLKAALMRNAAPRSRAYNACALAVAHARLGDAKRARALLGKAQALWPACDLLTWARGELPN